MSAKLAKTPCCLSGAMLIFNSFCSAIIIIIYDLTIYDVRFMYDLVILPFIFFRDEEHPEVNEGESYIEPEDGDHREA